MCVEDRSILQNSSLPHLRILRFTSNKLRIIPSRAFQNFPNLKVLDLNDNPISTIFADAFYPLSLHELKTNSSSLFCDCKLQWFSKWFLNSGLDGATIRMVCSSPSRLKGAHLLRVSTDQLTCGTKFEYLIKLSVFTSLADESPVAKIVLHPISLTKAVIGDNVLLSCSAHGATPVEIQWKIFDNGQSRFLSPNDNDIILINRSWQANGKHPKTHPTILGFAFRVFGK
jgi:hypothetical protein